MKKVLIVFGTRPEAIKMAPLIKAFENESDQFSCRVCVTGQHKEMLQQVLHVFDIQPAYDLSVMSAGQDLYDLSGKILKGMRAVLEDFKPDLVLVHGDTTTSTMAALAAFYQQIPVGHVEAGLRTGNIYSPWPEEMNRQLTGRLASFHFAPTETSKRNLIDENIPSEKIIITGNTVIDALKIVRGMVESDLHTRQDILATLEASGIEPSQVSQWEAGRRMVLITGHRRENFGDGFLNICEAIKELAEEFDDVDFVYPVHLNPSVKEPVFRILGEDKKAPNIFLLPPLDYLPFVFLMHKSHLILTDSGGIQEEAPGLGKPVIVMRDTTERPEAVKAGTVVLSGTDKNRIIEEVRGLLKDSKKYEKMATAHNPFGDGHAAGRIVAFIKAALFRSEPVVFEK